MERRALGRTGIEVSALGFGCGDVGGLIVRGEPAERVRAVARAVELGVNYFDTATSYGSGISEPLGEPAWPGFTELIEGNQRFEDVIRALRDSEVHVIPCGRSLSPGHVINSDSVSFLLDALDDVYDHIVVVARAEPATRLIGPV